MKSFKLPNQAGPEKSKTNLCTSKTVLGVTILRINGIKEGKSKTLEDYDERVNCFLEEKLHMDTSEISIEHAYPIGEKKTGQERQIVVQFNSYRNKLDILRNSKY